MSAKNDGLVLIGIARDEVEATVWKDLLGQEGIGVFIRSRDPMTSFGVTPVSGTREVFVAARDEKKARWLLGDAEPEPTTEE